MGKHKDYLSDFPLFYEEIGHAKHEQNDQNQKETAYERPSSLNEEQLAKLSDDLRSPMRDSSSRSNPLQ